jgi:hypothetical protein
VGKLLTLISKPSRGLSEVKRDSEAAESATTGATVEETGKQDLRKPLEKQLRKASVKTSKEAEEKESKSKPLDTRQQGSLF